VKRGPTANPRASIRLVALACARFPIAAIRPARIPTSAEYHGHPVPSMMCPLATTTSNGAGDCAYPTGTSVSNETQRMDLMSDAVEETWRMESAVLRNSFCSGGGILRRDKRQRLSGTLPQVSVLEADMKGERAAHGVRL